MEVKQMAAKKWKFRHAILGEIKVEKGESRSPCIALQGPVKQGNEVV